MISQLPALALPCNGGSRLTVPRSDVSGAERKEEDDTATAILKKKKKPNQLMYVEIGIPAFPDSLGDWLTRHAG